MQVYQSDRSTLLLDFQIANYQWRVCLGASLERVKDTTAGQLLCVYPVSTSVAKAVAFHAQASQV